MVKPRGNNHIDIENGSFSNGNPYTPSAHDRNNTYNYTSDVNFSASLVELKDSSNIKHIESTYTPSVSEPNFTQANINNYKAEKIYITNVVHNVIPGLTEENNNKTDADGNPLIIGELIIEHSTTSASDNGSKLYSCFFLTKNNTGDVNNIDTLIAMVDADKNGTFETINIGRDIPTQTQSIFYTSKGNKVVVFFAPIAISDDSFNIVKDLNYDMSQQFLATNINIKNEPSLQDRTKTYIYTNTNANANVKSASMTMGAVAMGDVAENDESYLECTPTGEGPDTIATYHVPINSEYTKDATRIKSQQTLMNMITFAIIIGCVYLVVPPAYFQLVYVTLLKKSNFGGKQFQTGEGIRNFDWTLMTIYFGILIGVFALLIPDANANANVSPDISTYRDQLPLYGICFFLLSFFAINNAKKNNGEFTRIFDYDGNGDIHNPLRNSIFPLSPFDKNGEGGVKYNGFIPFLVGTLFYGIIHKDLLAFLIMLIVGLVLFAYYYEDYYMAGSVFLLCYGLFGYAHYVYT
jgi:hypothetical protein